MARTFEDDDLQRLKKNTSIEALCRERGIELKKHGSRDLIGLCPFHEDKKPSFVVTPEKNLFHCLGCDAGGSVIDLVMKLDGLDFRQAVDKLLVSSPAIRRAADAPPKSKPTSCPAKLPERSGVPPERARQLLERIVSIYTKTFSEVPDGRKYLEGRGITNAGLFIQYRTGFSNGTLCNLLPKDGPLKEELKTIGILLDNGHERFAGCDVFPVLDADGHITTLYGRFTGDGHKRHVFLPDRSTGLWNVAAVKTHSEIILVESVIDGLSVMMAGHRNVIAIQGTNGLDETDIRTLKTHGVQLITLLLDGDDAGGKAAARLRPRLEAAGLTVTVKALPAVHDPNSYLVAEGAETFARFLASDAWTPSEMQPAARPACAAADAAGRPTDFIPEGQDPASRSRFAEQATAGNSTRAKGETLSGSSGTFSQSEDREAPPPAGPALSSSNGPALSSSNGPVAAESGNGTRFGSQGDGLALRSLGEVGLTVTYGVRKYRIMGLEKGPRKLKATVRVEHAGKLHVDTLDFYSARSRSILAQDLCRIYEETPETIDGDLQRLLVECEKHQPTSETRQEKSPLETLSAKEKEEAETFGKSPDLIERILRDFETTGLIGEENNKLLGYIAMTSRKRDTPLSVLILSSSGAGKTALQDAVLAFCPPEDLVKLTALSGKALFYKEQTSLKHKVLALEEGDGAEEASYAIRNLISAKELVSESTIKDLATGRLTTMENKVEGPTPVFLTTTRPEIDPETKSRFFVTSVDESREQTRKILSFQRRLHESDGLITSPEIEAILKKHRNFQRLLKQIAVKNPFAGKLTYGDDRLQGRRDQPKYLNLIKAIAFLRQMQKEVFYEQRNGSTVPAVAVDVDDIRLANKLANEILGHSLDELSRPGRDLLLLIEELATARLKEQQKRDKESKTRPTDIPFSRRELREFTGWTNTRLHIHLKELVDFEYIVIEAGRNGTPFRYRLAWEGQGKDGKRFMLGLKDVDGLADPDGKEPKK
jgi:DNA primase catalytic core